MLVLSQMEYKLQLLLLLLCNMLEKYNKKQYKQTTLELTGLFLIKSFKKSIYHASKEVYLNGRLIEKCLLVERW